MDYSTAGLPIHHQLPELAQTHIHRVNDARKIPWRREWLPTLSIFARKNAMNRGAWQAIVHGLHHALRRKWQPTSVFLPGESQGREPGGLLSMGSHRVRYD